MEDVLEDRRAWVLVYDDEGAGRRSVEHTVHSLRRHLDPAKYDVRRINAAQCRSAGGDEAGELRGWMDKAVLLAVPGGADVPYDRALRGAGNANIRRFVAERGGAYLGVCAGAYYGCARVEFEKGSATLQVCEDRELGFFAGTAKGAHYPGFAYASERGARAALIVMTEHTAGDLEHTAGDQQTDVEQAVVYYNGGCSFVGSDPSCTPLAFYDSCPADDVGKDVAIVECRVGNGTAVLCGVHPEHDPRLLVESEELMGDPHLQAIMEPLLAGDQQRQSLFRFLLRRLGLSLSPPHVRSGGHKHREASND